MAGGVRERSREILRAELAAAAFDFCARHGFDEVTVEDISEGIGISRATFFRYFRSKEDAILVAAEVDRLILGQALRSGHFTAGDSALAVVRRDLDSAVDQARTDPSRLRARLAMIGALPSLRSRLAADRADQGQELTTALEIALGDGVAAKTVAAAAMAAIGLGWSLWVDEPGSDLGDQFDRAFALIAQVDTVRLS